MSLSPDDRCQCEQIDGVKRVALITVDCSRLPEWLRTDICAQVNAHLNRVETWLRANPKGMHALEKAA